MLDLVYRETANNRIDVYVFGVYQGEITRSTWDLCYATSTVRETFAAEVPVKSGFDIWAAVEQLLERESRQYAHCQSYA